MKINPPSINWKYEPNNIILLHIAHDFVKNPAAEDYTTGTLA